MDGHDVDAVDDRDFLRERQQRSSQKTREEGEDDIYTSRARNGGASKRHRKDPWDEKNRAAQI